MYEQYVYLYHDLYVDSELVRRIDGAPTTGARCKRHLSTFILYINQ